MERETKDLVTPLGNKVTIKTYLTGAESDDIMRGVLQGETSADKPTVRTTAGLDRVIATLRAAIVSFNGVAEGAFDKINNLPLSERNFVMTEFNKVSNGDFQTGK